MITVDLNNLDLTEFSGKEKAGLHCLATFPLFGAHGSENSATVYFELEPGDALGWHTDSVEELLLILKGDVEVSVGEETGKLKEGQIALVPTMVRHNLRNIGSEKARVLGFFGSANFVATFDEVWLPTNSNMVDTAAMVAQAA
ncbi:MAG: cupin [Anaerolineaceae bacterium]|nr:cupin [Anaerolineaceae bacterium]